MIRYQHEELMTSQLTPVPHITRFKQGDEKVGVP